MHLTGPTEPFFVGNLEREMAHADRLCEALLCAGPDATATRELMRWWEEEAMPAIKAHRALRGIR
jgi:hypothetical protein